MQLWSPDTCGCRIETDGANGDLSKTGNVEACPGHAHLPDAAAVHRACLAENQNKNVLVHAIAAERGIRPQDVLWRFEPGTRELRAAPLDSPLTAQEQGAVKAAVRSMVQSIGAQPHAYAFESPQQAIAARLESS